MSRQSDLKRIKELEQESDPNDREQSSLLAEMRQHLHKLQSARASEDPRLSFSTPEFKEAQRTFTENFKKNFGRPTEYVMVKEYPWSTPQLRRRGPETTVDDGGSTTSQPLLPK